MRRMLPILTVVALGVSVVAVGAGPTGAAKLQKACRVLTPAEIETVVGIPIGEPDGAGSSFGCSFDIGDGIGSPGGGLVITQYQTGNLAKNLWGAAKANQERVGKLYWDPTSGIASGFRKGKLFAVSVTITGTDDAEHQAEAVELVNLGLKKV
ncbi:MAG: hypothetical protein WDA60_14465 [Acidimicrobiia bacterium]